MPNSYQTKNSLSIFSIVNHFILSRIFFLYIIIGVMMFLLFDCRLIEHRARLKALNRISTADSSAFLLTVEKGIPFDKSKLDEHRFYYENVIRFLPQGADSHGMLAFCYYHLGYLDQAIAHYKEAVSLMPKFFLFHYNLGFIYYQKKDYEKAKKYFGSAVLTDLKENLQLLTNSRIYFPFFGSDPDVIEDNIKGRERDNYQNAYKMLVLSCHNLKNHAGIVQYANEALAISLPDYLFFKFYLGVVMYELKRYDQALMFFTEILREIPDDPKVVYYAALCIKENGKADVGNALIQKAEYLSRIKKSALDSDESFRLRLF